MTNLETPGSAWRRQYWVDAGSPFEADFTRLQFAGADSVRWLLQRALRKLPPEVRYFCVEAIDWIEVGRDAMAWAHHAPPPRALQGDMSHRVSLCGRFSDEVMLGTIGHEVSHRWRSAVLAVTPPPLPLADVDMLAMMVYAASRVQTEDEQWLERACWISSRIAEEKRADEQARAWGFDWPGHDHEKLLRSFSAKYDEARRMAKLCAEHADVEPRRGVDLDGDQVIEIAELAP